MFDALGFQGIWSPRRGTTPEAVLAKLEHLHMAANTADTSGSTVRRTITMVSDTVVMTTSPMGGATQQDQQVLTAVAIELLCVAVSDFIYEAALTDPTLVYRGAISFGAFEIADRFFVGPAIDDAATHMESANAGLVWLTPTAADLTMPSFVVDMGPTTPAMVPWQVPLKGGDRLSTWAVNPFYGPSLKRLHDPGAARHWIDRSMRSFNDKSVRVRVLRENTRAFYSAALAHQNGLPVPAELTDGPSPSSMG